MTDNELPGMWEQSDFSGGETDEYVRGPNPYEGKSLSELEGIMDSEGYRRPDRRLPVRKADAAQYEREPIPEEQRGQIRVRLLNATPDPLGSIAALIEQYKGHVIRNLSEVTDDQRRAAIDEMTKTVLNGPLEAAQFHFQIEGVTRSITHQMVRSRASFFAQESLRFAVPEGDWSEEIPLPPSLAGAQKEREKFLESFVMLRPDAPPLVQMLDEWEDVMLILQQKYQRLIELGMPAEEARGILPHDMPTRIHWVLDLRTLLAEAGKRTCTQAQFPWRMIFAGVANELRHYRAWTGSNSTNPAEWFDDGWQFRLIADKIRPVCYQTGSCGFMAKFDRSCSIRERVDANARIGRPSSDWNRTWLAEDPAESIPAINDSEWALNPAAARS